MASKALDQDLFLKLRLKRILFLLGYYSPIEVELSYYSEADQKNRKSLTDLDVLGLKYDPILTSHKIVCDCKSGRVSDVSRLFWLKGVSEYFGANTAFFVSPSINNHARAIAPKLGLRVIDEKELSEMEANLKADSLVLPLTDVNFYQAYISIWGLDVPTGTKPNANQLRRKDVYHYLDYTYWYVDQHRNLFMLLDRYETIASELQYRDQRDVLLAYVGLQRFAHCLLEIGNYVYARGLGDLPFNSRIYLYGGSLPLREREQLFSELSKLGIRGLDNQLDPRYLPLIFESLNRIVRNPYSASKTLLYLEAAYYWCVMMGNDDLTRVFNGNIDTGSIVLAKDLCITFCRASGLDERLFSALMKL